MALKMAPRLSMMTYPEHVSSQLVEAGGPQTLEFAPPPQAFEARTMSLMHSATAAVAFTTSQIQATVVDEFEQSLTALDASLAAVPKSRAAVAMPAVHLSFSPLQSDSASTRNAVANDKLDETARISSEHTCTWEVYIHPGFCLLTQPATYRCISSRAAIFLSLFDVRSGLDNLGC